MTIDFIDRGDELRRLRALSRLKSPPFVVLVGRRRVGKTRLVQEFAKSIRDPLYLFVEEKRAEILLREWSGRAGSGTLFTSWEPLVRHFLSRHPVVVIDEFQNFARVDPSFFTTLQKILDEEMHSSMLILVGSYVGMMRKIFEDRGSPLFGRATEIWNIPPLPMADVLANIKGDFSTRMAVYSMFGGYPKYYSMLEQYGTREVEDIWAKLVIPKYSPLSMEPHNILLQEFGGEHRAYFSILEAIALGKRTYTEISDYTGLSTTTLGRYMSDLSSFEIVERRFPITEGAGSKKSRYGIKDEFIRFWFRYIFPRMDLREAERYDEILDLIKSDFPSFVSFKFEEVARELVSRDYGKTGAWWDRRGEEIDIVSVDEKRRDILFGEVKWKDRPAGWNVVEELRRKSGLVQWGMGRRKERHLVVSRAGFTRQCLERMDAEGVLHWDIRDVERMIRKSRG
ncbi:MAG: ATP-binding protein [Candidatus Thermoplasmatota archaeon]